MEDGTVITGPLTAQIQWKTMKEHNTRTGLPPLLDDFFDKHPDAYSEFLDDKYLVDWDERGVAVWKTKDGREIPLDKLSDNHLTSILAMLARNGHTEMRIHVHLVAEKKKRGLA